MLRDFVVLHGPRRLDGPTEQQKLLCQRGFSCVGVGNDGERAATLDLLLDGGTHGRPKITPSASTPRAMPAIPPRREPTATVGISQRSPDQSLSAWTKTLGFRPSVKQSPRPRPLDCGEARVDHARRPKALMFLLNRSQ